jgi:hypothetical protein
MKLLLRFWKKILTAAIAGSTSFFIAACYGSPYNYGFIGNWNIRVKTSDNKPIQGLKVSILEYVVGVAQPDTLDSLTTDSTGTVWAQLEAYHRDQDYHHAALIRDVDGDMNNGEFRDTLIAKRDSTETTVILNRQ